MGVSVEVTEAEDGVLVMEGDGGDGAVDGGD